MTTYHFIPGVKRAQQEHLSTVIEGGKPDSKEVGNYRKSHKEKLDHANLATKMDDKSSRAYCLEEEGELKGVLETIQDGDDIVIHGEGEPFVLGFNEPTVYDLQPHRLLMLLIENGLPRDKHINIDLKSCHSAAECRGMNFARDTSMLLGLYGYHKISVTGYTGLIIEKPSSKQIKFSCQADPFPTADIESDPRGVSRKEVRETQHSSIENARVIYVSGSVVSQGRRGSTNPLSDLNGKPFSWATKYIAEYTKGIEEARKAAPQQAPVVMSRSGYSFLSSPRVTTELVAPESPSETPSAPSVKGC